MKWHIILFAGIKLLHQQSYGFSISNGHKGITLPSWHTEFCNIILSPHLQLLRIIVESGHCICSGSD